jgi:cell division protease FtsH
MGAPGGGKTLLAKAVAAQGNATYISTSGSRFVNGLVGGGANAIRRLRDAIEQAPDDMVVLFIDELDALGSRSGMGGEMGASGSEDLKTINEFLAFTDGIKKIGNKRLLLIGATNRPEALDPAILSRFNQKVEIQELNTKQREEVISKQMEQKNLQPDYTVDIHALAKRLKDFSGRDIRNLMINVQEKLESKLAEDEEQLKKYEDNPEALKSVRLEVSHKDLMETAREIKRSKRQIDKNSESGEYGGGKPENGGRKLYTITG